MSKPPTLAKIGKYQILERIGRGGMGTVFRAHDPILDRTVALKVISSDIEIGDELRVRFFREAQACARLSHPNIITVYDLADLDGQLVIVMEFLEGDALKHLISQERDLGLAFKLDVMVQICDGLAYAHQRGIVHRDIKPDNIFVLRTGTAKILDFGIAHIANAEGGLTRTGLVMGTLRYMAPEQARGRADYRADIFAMGAVFYELVSGQPAFPGTDPMQILEALRSQEPRALNELDPDIPIDLANLITKALRKDPAERISDLTEMRRGLQAIRQRLLDDIETAKRRIRELTRAIRQVAASLADDLGSPVIYEPIPDFDHATRVTDLRTIEVTCTTTLTRLRALDDRAAAVRPVFEQGQDLLRAGNFEAAARQFRSVTQQVPEHSRARAALTEATTALEHSRSRERLGAVLMQAHAALDKGAFDECLAILAGFGHETAPEDLATKRSELQRAAEAARAAQEAAERSREARRRERQFAAVARTRAIEAKARALTFESPQEAPARWRSAEQLSADAELAFETEGYSAAQQGFQSAADAYAHAEAEARERRSSRQHAAADAARLSALEARKVAESLHQESSPSPLWTQATEAESHAIAMMEDRDFDAACHGFDRAREAYERLVRIARVELLARQRKESEQVLRAMEESRAAAEEINAAENTPTTWAAAETESASGKEAWDRRDFAAATEHFKRAQEVYHAAAVESRSAIQTRNCALAQESRVLAATARQSAQSLHAAALSPEPWASACQLESEAVNAFANADYIFAQRLFDEARGRYADAAADAKQESARRERQHAERRRAGMEDARAIASGRELVQTFPSWEIAESQRSEGGAAFEQLRFTAAAELFQHALENYQLAAESAAQAMQALQQARDGANALRAAAADAREMASAAGAQTLASGEWAKANEALRAGDRALADGGYDEAARLFMAAQRAFQLSESAARKAFEAYQRARESADRCRQDADLARQTALDAGAMTWASDQCSAANSALAEAHRALTAEDYDRSTQLFAVACRGFEEAAATARLALDAYERSRREAEALRESASYSRQEALEIEAPERASQDWRDADDLWAVAQRAFDTSEFAVAAERFAEARDRFKSSAQTARRILAERQDRADVLARDASRLLKTGDHAGAIALAEEAVALVLDHAVALRVRTEAETALHRQQEKQRQIEAMLLAARGLLETGRTIDALKPLQEIVDRDPHNLEASQMLDHARGLLHADRHASGPDAAAPNESESRPIEVAPASNAPRVTVPVLPSRAEAIGRIPATIPPAAHTFPPRRPAVMRRLVACLAVLIVTSALASYVWWSRSPQAPMSLEPPQAVPQQETPKSVDSSVPRASAEAARQRSATARTAAEVADAPRSARSAFDHAAEVQRRAEAAMGVERFEESERHFREATTAFEEATGQARRFATAAAAEAEARGWQERTAQARHAAAVVDAARWAKKGWEDARAAEDRAARELRGNNRADAQRSYADAEKRYRDAEGSARQEIRSQAELERVRQSRERFQKADHFRQAANTARRAAEENGAPTLSSVLFQAAERRQNDGAAALERQDYGVAETQFGEATRTFQRAAEEARSIADAEARRVATLQQQRTEAEQARDRTTQARRSAEQVAADRYASAGMSAARAKEREAQEAFAAQHFTRATTLFQSAGGEFRTASEASAPLHDLERLRSMVVSRRELAVKAEANVFATAALGLAAAKEKSADDLAARNDIAGAKRAYQDAAAAYDDAAGRARGIQDDKAVADAERIRMLAEKQKARGDAAEFAAGAEQERQGATSYERASFKEAADDFRKATRLYAKAAATPPDRAPVPAVDPRAEVRATLEAFRRAFESKDLALLQKVRPGLSSRELRMIGDTFGKTVSYKVELRIDAIELQGSEASVRAVREDVLVANDGRTHRSEPRSAIFRLKRVNGEWTIQDIK